MITGAGGLMMIVLRFVVLTATVGALGAWIFARFVVPAADDAVAAHRPRLARMGGRVAMTCTALIALLAVPRLVAQARSLMDPGDPLADMMLAVMRTHWGWALAVQAVAALVAFAALWPATRDGVRSRVAESSVITLAIVPAFMGHAIADPGHRVLSMAVDILHVAAAGGWVGTLALLTLAAWRHRREADASVLVASLIVAFHPIAMVTAGTVFVTGLGTAWLRMGAPAGIADPTYSGLFVAKLLLVGVTGAIGAGHAKQAKKRVRRVEPATIGRTLLGETLLAVLVLAVTAVLAGTAPIG
ncbi:MAG: CopD family protein [Gemmatimonadaceae bacterium]